MGSVIEIDELSNEIANILSSYNEDVEKTVEDELKRTAQELKRDIENNPNIPVSNIETKHYKNQFAIKKNGYGGYILYNRKYQLTHLLEYGHATINGKRTRAFPHWKQADEKAQNLFNALKQRLEDIK